MNHESASALQAASVGLGTLIASCYPEHAKAIAATVGGLFSLLGIIKPWLPPRVRQAFGG
jgi:hypothetical protein